MKYKGIPGIWNYFRGRDSNRTENVEGVIPALLINHFSQSRSKALTLAGIANLSKEGLNGVNLAGITNASEEIRGVNIAGVTNYSSRCEYSGGDISGINLSLFNQSSKNLEGISVGLLNSADSIIKGVSVGGINGATYMNGFSFGLLNWASEQTRGVYLGLVNILNSENKWYDSGFSGLSVGLINYSKTSKRLACQVGLYNNISENGGLSVQIGLVNRSGNRTIPGINIRGIRDYLRSRIKKEKQNDRNQ
jgi:hypothetical protein